MVSPGRPRVPPGRAGRLWLRGRLATAERGLELLDRKLRILRREQERLRLLERRTGEELRRSCGDAERWLLRAALLGGQRGLGIRYPAEATCALPKPAPPPPAATAALGPATDAYRAALAAAVAHAAATAAVRVVDEEVAETRQRLRAIENRRIPRLHAALAELELSLDELEQADNARLRRAMTGPAGRRGRGDDHDQSHPAGR
jgi:V/A-type H+-transporting ATPase subunit D